MAYSSTVAAQQTALNKQGANLKVDGISGPLTQAAATKYASAYDPFSVGKNLGVKPLTPIATGGPVIVDGKAIAPNGAKPPIAATKPTSVVSASGAKTQVDKAKNIVDTSSKNKDLYDSSTGFVTSYGLSKGAKVTQDSDPYGNKTTTNTPKETGSAEDQIMNTPDAGNQFFYNSKGERTELPVGSTPPAGYSSTKASVKDVASLSTGSSIKKMSDGTYGLYGVDGTYIGESTPEQFNNIRSGQEAQDAFNDFLASGGTNLNATQKAQIAAVKTTYDGILRKQETSNANATGAQTIAQNLYGMGNNLIGHGEITETVNNGIAELTTITSKMNENIAEMTLGFEKDNLEMVKTGFDAYQVSSKNLQDSINTFQSQITKQQDKLELKQQDYALTAAAKYRDTTEPISQYDSPQEVDRKVQTSAVWQNEQKTKSGRVDLDAIKGMVDSYKVTGIVPSFSGLMGAPQREAFWAAVGGDVNAIGTATGNKLALKASSTALDNQTKIGQATKTAVTAMEGGIKIAEDLSKKFERTGSPIANKYILWTEGKLGLADAQTKADINAFDAAITTVAQEYAKIMTGAAASIAGTTVSSQEEAKAFINKELTKKQLSGVFDVLRADAKIRLTSYESTINSIKNDISELTKTTLGTSSGGDFAEAW